MWILTVFAQTNIFTFKVCQVMEFIFLEFIFRFRFIWISKPPALLQTHVKSLKYFHVTLKFYQTILGQTTVLEFWNGKSTGKVMVTPYGGRIEYNIAGTPMVIHLKDSEKCQRGKRWSQVMYLYYLIGWKIDACSDMTGKALIFPYICSRYES